MEGFCGESNDLQALKLTIVRSLASLSHAKNGNHVNITNISVDMPLSPQQFMKFFPVEYSANRENFKQTLSVEDLNSAFGLNWHIFKFPNSSTRKRVIGVVLLHFRKKRMTVFEEESSGW